MLFEEEYSLFGILMVALIPIDRLISTHLSITYVERSDAPSGEEEQLLN